MMNNNQKNRIIENARMKIAISNFEKEDIELKAKNRILKMVATFLLAIGITGGLVYATVTEIEKIWKEPEPYKINKELTQEEKLQCISEEEAENIGNSYLKKIGLDEDDIKNLNLAKEYSSGENIWCLYSQKASIKIDAKTGSIKYVQIPTWNYTIPYNYGIDRVEARKVAKELLEKYKIEDDEGEYELVKLTRNMETDEGSYIWYADFYKKYGDLLNPYESIKIGWIPTINGLYSLYFENDVYENNEEKITKEKAIKIAIEKDKQLETIKTIKETKAEIKIKKMNENVYLREHFKDEYEKGIFNYLQETGENTYILKEDATFYKSENRVRKVWVIVIKYDVSEDSVIKEYSYYVDCTTGEIIGGDIGDKSQTIEKMISDPYNLIEK